MLDAMSAEAHFPSPALVTYERYRELCRAVRRAGWDPEKAVLKPECAVLLEDAERIAGDRHADHATIRGVECAIMDAYSKGDSREVERLIGQRKRLMAEMRRG